MDKTNFIWPLVFTLAVLLSGCGGSGEETGTVSLGASSLEVKAELGEPRQIREFSLPESPFFGPQEILTDLLPAGALVEEWIYAIGEDELFVWFAGESDQPRDQWRVIETARHPAGAVY